MIGGGSSNGVYSQLTNATSSSALNSAGISNLNLNSVINSSANNTASSSPINMQQFSAPPVVNSLIASDVMKRSDSKGKLIKVLYQIQTISPFLNFNFFQHKV